MIVGIGIDVVEIRRIRQLARRHATFLSRTFAPVELHHCQAKANPFPTLPPGLLPRKAASKASGVGRASGRERGENLVGGGSLKKKKKKSDRIHEEAIEEQVTDCD